MSVSATGTPARTLTGGAWRRRLSYTQDASLVCISALFYVHATHAVEARSVANVFFALEQGLLVGMFLTRRRTNTTSTRPWDWFVATIGGWLPLAMRPQEAGGSIEAFGTFLQVAGLSCVIVSFATLGKSFGVVAPRRLKVGGRTASSATQSTCRTHHTDRVLSGEPWWLQQVILVTVTVLKVLRIQGRRRVLAATSEYESYRTGAMATCAGLY